METMPVKNVIKEFVDGRGMSVYQFRAETGIAAKTAYDLYNNPRQLPGSAVLSRLCDRYEVQPTAFVRWFKEVAS
jgi:hypothetical protein